MYMYVTHSCALTCTHGKRVHTHIHTHTHDTCLSLSLTSNNTLPHSLSLSQSICLHTFNNTLSLNHVLSPLILSPPSTCRCR